MIERILSFLFPSTLRLAPEELHAVLDYHERQRRARTPSVDSEASPAISMMLYRPAAGFYVGLGREVIAERRVENRPVQVERRRAKKK